jgi:hypothetical protein
MFARRNRCSLMMPPMVPQTLKKVNHPLYTFPSGIMTLLTRHLDRRRRVRPNITHPNCLPHLERSYIQAHSVKFCSLLLPAIGKSLLKASPFERISMEKSTRPKFSQVMTSLMRCLKTQFYPTIEVEIPRQQLPQDFRH